MKLYLGVIVLYLNVCWNDEIPYIDKKSTWLLASIPFPLTAYLNVLSDK